MCINLLQILSSIEAPIQELLTIVYGTIANLLALALAGYFGHKFLFRPNLILEEAPLEFLGNKTIFQIGIKNRKKFQAINREDIYVQLFFPANFLNEDIVKDKKVIIEMNGRKENPWEELKKLGAEQLLINNFPYICLKMIPGHNIFPRRTIMFLRGTIENHQTTEYIKIYYKFSTRYGMVPKNDSDEFIFKGKLPFIELKLK